MTRVITLPEQALVRRQYHNNVTYQLRGQQVYALPCAIVLALQGTVIDTINHDLEKAGVI